MLTEDSGDSVARRWMEDVGFGNEGGAGQRDDGREIETEDQTVLRRRPKVGQLGLVETHGIFVLRQ